MTAKGDKINLSYDYEELLNNLQEDVKSGMLGINDVLFIVRGNERSGYYPIIGYFYDDCPPQEEFEIAIVRDVLKEMKYMDRVIK